MVKKIITILLCLIFLTTGLISGFFIGENNEKNKSDFDVIYKNINKLSTEEKTALFQSKLKAETSPTEVRYLMEKIIPSVSDDVKNNMFSLYLNHVQYYMSTYSSFIMIYESIIMNARGTINFEKASSANLISDQVLKTIITEIYNSDMKIVMPPSSSNASLYIVLDYDKVIERYDFINDANKKYIAFKEIVQRGDLADTNGNYNIDKLGEYIILANNFITEYPKHPLIGDVVHSYILASKMYMGIYDVDSEFIPDAATIEKYIAFVDSYPDTPISTALQEIIDLYNNNEMISMDRVNSWNTQLDSLLQGE